MYKLIKNIIRNKIKKIRNLEFLNKFWKGVKITRINPNKLLIKKRGNRKTFVQKLFMFNVDILISIIYFTVIYKL